MNNDFEAEGADDLDIVDPDTYRSGFPQATFERLRRTDPVSWWDEHDGGSGFWAVTRYHDVLAVSRNVSAYSNAHGVTLEEMEPADFEARRNMLEYDPPEHTRYRRLVSRPFSRREVMGYEDGIRAIARSVLDEALPRASTVHLDVTERIAKQLPMRMLGRLLGVPDADGPWLVEKGDALLGNFDPEMTPFPVGLVDTDEFRAMPFRSPAGVELYQYAEEQARLRTECPMHDVINTLLQPTTDGERLSDRQFKNFFVLLVGAGNDTTRYTMAAALRALAEHPDQFRELQAAVGNDPVLIDSAVEEILRYATVTMHFRRTALVDTEIGGKRISAGDKVVIWFASADRDHEVFANPYRFDIRRAPNPHVAFGLQGPHLCLGAPLARLELRILLEEMLPRVREMHVDGPVEWLRSNFIGGMKHLPMTITTR